MLSYTIHGVTPHPVTVTARIERRLPATVIVGLPTSLARETSERVRAAIIAEGYDYPRQRVIVEIDSDVPIRGCGLDLPIAIAILEASGQAEPLDGVSAFAELSLGGNLRYVRGTLAARPMISANSCASLAGAVAVAEGRVAAFSPPTLTEVRPDAETPVSGATRVLLRGAPGAPFVKAARSMLPAAPMDADLLRQVAEIHDAAGLLRPGDGSIRRPFRAPHHTVSMAGLFGGATLRPGEVSLANGGVLYLDEVAEFSRQTLALLPAVLEARSVTLSRTSGTARLPADFVLVASAPRHDFPGELGERYEQRVSRIANALNLTTVEVARG